MIEPRLRALMDLIDAGVTPNEFMLALTEMDGERGTDRRLTPEELDAAVAEYTKRYEIASIVNNL